MCVVAQADHAHSEAAVDPGNTNLIAEAAVAEASQNPKWGLSWVGRHVVKSFQKRPFLIFTK